MAAHERATRQVLRSQSAPTLRPRGPHNNEVAGPPWCLLDGTGTEKKPVVGETGPKVPTSGPDHSAYQSSMLTGTELQVPKRKIKSPAIPPAKKIKTTNFKVESLQPFLRGPALSVRPKERMYNASKTTAAMQNIGSEDIDVGRSNLHLRTESPSSWRVLFDLGTKRIAGFDYGKNFSSSPDFESLENDATIRAQIKSTAPSDEAHESDSEPGEEESERVNRHRHLDYGAAPISDIYEIFEHMAAKAFDFGIRDACNPFKGGPLRVVTMCSGTESPVLSMRLMQRAFEKQNFSGFKFDHLASAEIEPFKQAYIQRNFAPPIIFRDVTEFQERPTPNAVSDGASQDPKYSTKEEDYANQKPHTVHGGVADKPERIHMLVAGSSCVDYSMLNQTPLAFGTKGESFSTMMGVRDYAKFCRPNVVILENVKTAPWEDIAAFWEEIDYIVRVVYVDSKNFYLPQTRQRGYLIALDAQRATAANVDTTTLLENWQDYMTKFQHRASSPYTDFICADDDPALDVTKRAIAVASKPAGKTQDWAACRHRYSTYRVSQELGFSRPVSLWQNNGSCKFPDNSWHFWTKAQRERIWDTLDIDQLRYVRERDYDMTYKHRCVDLSQNMDREVDNKHWGIVGCLCPAGMPYDTRRGGPITGREALALQGIPVDELILNKENSRELQDLAGNAMTTTVVGAAIFSAVIAGAITDPADKSIHHSPIFAEFLEEPQVSETTSSYATSSNIGRSRSFEDIKSSMTSPCQKVQSLDIENAEQPTSKLIALAGSSRQLCRCEGFSKNKPGSFKQCTDCGHTACLECAGNPPHNYLSLDLLGRKLPGDFVSSITAALPRSLQLTNENGGLLQFPASSQDLKSMVECFNAALNSRYRFNGIKRTSEWKVEYEAPNAHLELRFVPSFRYQLEKQQGFLANAPMACYWLLFAKCKKSEAANSSLRPLSVDPIAKMSPDDAGSLLSGKWQIRTSSTESLKMAFKGCIPLLDAWEKKLGLQNEMFTDLKTYSIVQLDPAPGESISDTAGIRGQYQSLPNCGGASGSMHRKIDPSRDGPCTFLFLDPEPLGDASDDTYVVSAQNGRRSLGDRRDVVARFQKGWRPSQKELDKSFVCETGHGWKDQQELRLECATGEEGVDVCMPSSLGDQNFNKDCQTKPSVLLIADVPLDVVQQQVWQSGKSYPLDLIDRPDCLKSLTWALTHAGKHGISEGWQDVTALMQEASTFADCNCAPQYPSFSWQWTRARRGTKYVIKPFENAEEADKFEKQLKDRAPLISSRIHSLGDHAVVEVRLNVAALLHRTMALHLSGLGAFDSQEARWRIIKNDAFTALPKMEKFNPPSNKDQAPWSPSTCLMDLNRLVPKSIGNVDDRPPNFSRPLWGSQLKTLTWMQSQEQNPRDWSEIDQIDTSIPSFEWRIECQVERRLKVRGGIIADTIGSGKTTTALALIATDLPAVTSAFAPCIGTSDTRIASDATLILVPQNLLGQWKSEIDQCFSEGNPESVLIIKSVQQLKTLTVEALRHTQVVLASWDLFEKVEYWASMRRLCCAPNVPPIAGRAFDQWLDQCVTDLGEVAQGSAKCTDLDLFWQLRHEMKAANKRKYAQFGGYCTRKDTKRDAKGDVKAEEKLKPPQDLEAGSLARQEAHPNALKFDQGMGVDFDQEIEDWGKDGKTLYPLLHLFSFRRLIVDEFTYLKGKSLLAILQLDALNRWMMSGTPPLTDFDSFNTMAKLLGTKLSSTDDRDGYFGFGKDGGKMAVEKSYAEEFREHANVVLTSSMHTRYDMVGKFVGQFMRKDAASMDGTSKSEHLIVINPSAVERATYLEFYLLLSSQSFTFNPQRCAMSAPICRQDQIHHAITSSSHAEEALTCSLSSLHDSTDPAGSSCQKIMASKEDDFVKTCEELLRELKEAFWYRNQKKEKVEENPHFSAYLDRALSGQRIGDYSVAKFMDSLIRYAYENPCKPDHMKVDLVKIRIHEKTVKEINKAFDDKHARWESKQQLKPEPVRSKYPELQLQKLTDTKPALRRREMMARATIMHTLTLRLVELAKSLRFFKSISNITVGEKVLECSACAKVPATYEAALLSGLCGHVICVECWRDQQDVHDGCPEVGCSANPSEQNLVPADSFDSTKTSVCTPMGSKMDAISKQILAISDDEYILIFVQYKRIRDQVIEALESANISYRDGSTRTEKTVQNFQDQAERNEHKSRALILMIDSADSAGWNLQGANHVMFVSPLVAQSRYDYESIMAQAIGRSFRPGQKKDEVHVYHFAMAGTIEVNILEDRHKKAIVKEGDEYVYLDVEEAASRGKERFRGLSLEFAQKESDEASEDGEDGEGDSAED